VIVLIFFVIYQQFENHVLQVSIMSRTVDLNPLAVLASVLIGVELFGLLGALLAIPAGGVLQVICRDIYDTNLGMLKDDPTIGSDEVPISELQQQEAAEEATAVVHGDGTRELPAAPEVLAPVPDLGPPTHGPDLPPPVEPASAGPAGGS
ncbi:MAG: AI-2E family transporter, partial [Acidimicrobiales bacterium]